MCEQQHHSQQVDLGQAGIVVVSYICKPGYNTFRAVSLVLETDCIKRSLIRVFIYIYIAHKVSQQGVCNTIDLFRIIGQIKSDQTALSMSGTGMILFQTKFNS